MLWIIRRIEIFIKVYDLNNLDFSMNREEPMTDYREPPEPKPIITYIILGINLILYFLMELAGGSTNSDVLIKFGAKVNFLLWTGEYWRLITPIFLHIGITHLLLNSWSLYVFGPIVEKVFGHLKFLIIYLAAGLIGSIMSFIMTPNLSAGASGAIFGLMGALLYFTYSYREVINRHFIINLLLVIGFNIYFGFTNQGIDNYAHLGGLFGGLITSTILGTVNESIFSKVRITFAIVWLAVTISLISLSLQPDETNPDWNFHQGNQAFNAHNYKSAAQYYQKVLAVIPKSEDTHFNLGLTYINTNKIPEAIKEMQTVVKLNPSHQDALTILKELTGSK
jgi:rhomboid protease GluP